MQPHSKLWSNKSYFWEWAVIQPWEISHRGGREWRSSEWFVEEAVFQKYEQRWKDQVLARSGPRDRNSECQEKKFSQTPQQKILYGHIFW